MEPSHAGGMPVGREVGASRLLWMCQDWEQEVAGLLDLKKTKNPYGGGGAH